MAHELQVDVPAVRGDVQPVHFPLQGGQAPAEDLQLSFGLCVFSVLF